MNILAKFGSYWIGPVILEKKIKIRQHLFWCRRSCLQTFVTGGRGQHKKVCPQEGGEIINSFLLLIQHKLLILSNNIPINVAFVFLRQPNYTYYAMLNFGT